MTKPSTQPSPAQNFESALADLAEIVRQMEEGQLPLEESLAAYKRGAELLQFCQKSLQHAEQQVRILNEQNNLQDFQITND
jgi:exodeoxyribonuclease VII small subunit